MGLIEAILLGLQFKNLQKPFIFFSMLIGFLFFALAGFGMFYGIYEIVISNKSGKFLPILGVLVFSVLFFGSRSLMTCMKKKLIIENRKKLAQITLVRYSCKLFTNKINNKHCILIKRINLYSVFTKYNNWRSVQLSVRIIYGSK